MHYTRPETTQPQSEVQGWQAILSPEGDTSRKIDAASHLTARPTPQKRRLQQQVRVDSGPPRGWGCPLSASKPQSLQLPTALNPQRASRSGSFASCFATLGTHRGIEAHTLRVNVRGPDHPPTSKTRSLPSLIRWSMRVFRCCRKRKPCS